MRHHEHTDRDNRCPGRHSGDLIGSILAENPEAQVLFIGSPNCLRHKPFSFMAEYMRAGKFSVLCPTMTDFASGRYIHQVKAAIAELSGERNAKQFVLIYSCQWVILSSDGELLRQELFEELGVELTLVDDSHLEYGDHR